MSEETFLERNSRQIREDWEKGMAMTHSDTGQGDLVERLREQSRNYSDGHGPLHGEAATALASLREERDAAKQEVERWKEGWSETWRKLGDGTLHEMHCNADHRKPVGESGAGCSCHFGRTIRGLRHSAEKAEAESASLRERVRVLEIERANFRAGLQIIRQAGTLHGGGWCVAQARGYLEDLDFDHWPETGRPPDALNEQTQAQKQEA